jgi:hypothetical protein
MDFLIASATTGSQTPITSDPVADALKAGQLFGVDMDHVAWLGRLVAANGLGRLQILEPTETQSLEQPSHGGERRR